MITTKTSIHLFTWTTEHIKKTQPYQSTHICSDTICHIAAVLASSVPSFCLFDSICSSVYLKKNADECSFGLEISRLGLFPVPVLVSESFVFVESVAALLVSRLWEIHAVCENSLFTLQRFVFDMIKVERNSPCGSLRNYMYWNRTATTKLLLYLLSESVEVLWRADDPRKNKKRHYSPPPLPKGSNVNLFSKPLRLNPAPISSSPPPPLSLFGSWWCVEWVV